MQSVKAAGPQSLRLLVQSSPLASIVSFLHCYVASAAHSVCSLPLKGGGLGRGSLRLRRRSPPDRLRRSTSPFQGEVRRERRASLTSSAAPSPPRTACWSRGHRRRSSARHL